MPPGEERPPKPEVIVPSTGQIRPAALGADIGPAGKRGKPGSRRDLLLDLRLEVGLDLREVPDLTVDPVDGRLAFGTGVLQLVLLRLDCLAGGGEVLLFGGDLVAGTLDRVLGLLQAQVDRFLLVAEAADPVDDVLVAVLDLREVLGALEQVPVVLRGHHEFGEVGVTRKVDRDEALLQDLDRAMEPRGEDVQFLVGLVDFGLGRVEFFLLGLEADLGVTLLGAEGGDLGLVGVDLAAEARDLVGEHAFLLIGLVDLPLGLFELGLLVRGGRGTSGPDRAGKRDEDEGKEKCGP